MRIRYCTICMLQRQEDSLAGGHPKILVTEYAHGFLLGRHSKCTQRLVDHLRSYLAVPIACPHQAVNRCDQTCAITARKNGVQATCAAYRMAENFSLRAPPCNQCKS